MLSEWIKSKIQFLQNCILGQDCTKHLYKDESGFGKGSTNVQAAIIRSIPRLHPSPDCILTHPAWWLCQMCGRRRKSFLLLFSPYRLKFSAREGGREGGGRGEGDYRNIDQSSWLTEVKSAEFLLKLRIVTGEAFPLVLKIRTVQLIKI